MKKTRTQYTKAKPLGMRGRRVTKICRSLKKAPVKSPRRVAIKSVTSQRVVRLLPAAIARPTLPEPRTYVQRRRVVLQFFSHSFSRSAAVLVLLTIFTATIVGRASTDVRTFRISPTNCTGWNAADSVRTIDANADADGQAISLDKSATIQSRTADQPASGDPQLKCKSFTLPEDFPNDVAISSAQLVISLAVQGNPESEDIIVLESSLDGQQWNKLDSFFLTEDLNNANHGGYWKYPFAKLGLDGIGTLQVRARFVSVPSDKQVSVRVDGLALDVNVRQQVSNADLKLPANTVQVDTPVVKTSQDPVVSVQVEQRSRFKFLGIGDTKRTVDSVQLTAPDGQVMAATYDATRVAQASGAVEKLAINTDAFTKPGKYTTEVTIVQDNKQTVVKSEFLWGVLVVNMDKSLYWPGETIHFGMGVLDPQGNTICDAALILKITAPNGSVQELTSENNKITNSDTCGPITVTDVPDYNAEYDTADAGTYAVELTAQTSSGTYTITDAVIAQPVIPISISRHGSMRIYPLADYTMAIDVRPQQAYKGVVEEYVPPSFKILKISDNGRIIKQQQRTILRWQVDIDDHSVKTLSYRYNPPDISPEIFRLGPLQVENVQETRQWQIASDIAGMAAAETTSTTTSENLEGEGRHLVFINNLTGYIFENTSAGSVSFRKSDNGGIDWGDPITITDQTDCENFAIWYDGWTPGNTGGLIHIAFLENGGDTIYYENVNTASSDTQKGEVAVYSDTASVRTSITDSLSITRATDGDLYVAISSSAANAVSVVRNSSDVGSNWATTADEGLDDATQDYVMLMPLTSADILLFRWDVSADDIQSKEYEDGANTWDAGWTNIDTTAVEDSTATWNETWAATISPNSNNIYLAYVDNAGTASATPDIRTAIYNGTSWTAKTNVVTDTNTILGVSIALDATTDDVYVVYTRGSTTVSSPYYKVSTDSMTTWSTTERGSVANIASNLRAIQTNLVSTEMLGVWVYDDTASDIWYGTIQDIGTLSGALQTTNFNGFESRDSVDADATAGTFSYNTTAGKLRSGEASLQSNPSAATGYVTHSLNYTTTTGVVNSTDTDVAQGVVAVYVDSGTAVSQQTNIITLLGGGVIEFEISINADQTLSITNDTDVNGAYALVDDTWYVIAFTASSDLGTAIVGIYSSDMTVLYETLNQAQTMADYDQVTVGVSTASTTADIYFDDLIVYDHDLVGNFPILRGDYHIAKMDADSAGSETAWTGVTCAGGDYLCINEIPTSTTNYIQSTTTGASYETSNLESAANAGITGTFMGLRVMNTIFESTSMTNTTCQGIRIRTDRQIPTTAINPTTTPQDIVKTYNITELQAAASFGVSTPPYLVADLDILQVGAGSTADPGTGYYRNGDSVTQVIFSPPKVFVSGKIYTDEGATAYDCASDNLTVYSATTGGTSRAGLCNTSAGSFTIVADVPTAADDPVAIFIDSSETPKATTVTLANDTTSTIAGADMYQNKMIVKQESATAMTNAKLATADNANAGIRYGVSSSNLTVESGIELHVWTGDAYDPGGTITTNTTGGDFHIDDSATAAIDTATSDIGLDIKVDGGATLNIDASVTVAGGDITTAGTSAIVTRTTGSAVTTLRGTGSIGGGTTPSITFYDLTLGDATLASTTTLSNTTIITNNVSVYTGSTFNINADLTINGGSLTNTTTGIINTTSGTPTVTMTATGNLGGGAGAITLYNLTKSTTGIVTVASAVSVINTIDISGGTLTVSATLTAGSQGNYDGNITVTGTLNGTSDIVVNNGDLSGTGTVTMTGGTATIYHFGVIGSSSATDWAFNDLSFTIGTTGCTLDYLTTTAAGSGSMTINGTLTTQSCSVGETTYRHTLDAGAKTWILNGAVAVPFVKNGGFIGNTSTVRYTAVNPSGTVTVAAMSSATIGYYYNLQIQPSSAETYVFSASQNYYVSNDLYVNSDATISSYVGNNGAVIIMNGAAGSIDANGETIYGITISGTITIKNTDVIVYNRLTVSGSTLTINSGINVTYNGLLAAATFTLTGTINGPGRLIYTPSTAFPTGGTLANSLILRFNTTTNNQTMSNRTDYGLIEIDNSGATDGRTVTMSATTHTLSGSLTVLSSGTGSVTLVGATNNPTVNIGGDLTYTAGGGTKTITTGTGVWTVSGNVNFTNGTFTATTGNTLKMNGASKTITLASQQLQKFEVSGGSIASADAMLVNSTFDVTSGGFTQAANANLTVYGNFTLAASTTFTAASGTGILVLDGNPTPNTFTDSTSPQQDLGNVEIGLSPGTTDLASDLVAKSLTVNAGDVLNTNGYDLNIGILGITIKGTLDVDDDVETNGTQMDTDGKFDLQAGATLANSAGTNVGSTLTFTLEAYLENATHDLITAGTGSLYNLVVNDGGGAYTLTVNVQDALVVLNNVTITGGILDTVDTENNQINVGGNWTNNDVFTARSGNVVFDDTNVDAQDQTINSGASSFYDVTFNGSGGVWSPLTNTMTVTNDLTMTSGTFNTSNGTANVIVNGNVQCGASCGTITMNTAGTNTFTQSVAADKSFGTNLNVATNWTFYNLTFTGTSGVRTITTNGTGTGQIIVANDLSLTNSGTSLALDNNTNDRILDVNGSVSIAADTTLSASSSASFTVAKSWTKNGAFTHNSGTVTLDSTNAATLIGSTTFNNLSTTGIGATKTITFTNGTTQTVSGTWTVTGAGGQLITLASDSPGTQWLINPTNASLSYVQVSDAHNDGAEICATYSTATGDNNTNLFVSAGASCVTEPTLTVTLSATSASLGVLDTEHVNQAGITSEVTTNATDGYISTVKYDHTLTTSGSDTIPDTAGGNIPIGSAEFGASSSQAGNTIAQWSPAACSTTTNTTNATALSTSSQTFASKAAPATAESTTLCFVASISAITTAGSYSSAVTFITTGRF